MIEWGQAGQPEEGVCNNAIMKEEWRRKMKREEQNSKYNNDGRIRSNFSPFLPFFLIEEWLVTNEEQRMKTRILTHNKQAHVWCYFVSKWVKGEKSRRRCFKTDLTNHHHLTNDNHTLLSATILFSFLSSKGIMTTKDLFPLLLSWLEHESEGNKLKWEDNCEDKGGERKNEWMQCSQMVIFISLLLEDEEWEEKRISTDLTG